MQTSKYKIIFLPFAKSLRNRISGVLIPLRRNTGVQSKNNSMRFRRDLFFLFRLPFVSRKNVRDVAEFSGHTVNFALGKTFLDEKFV